MSSKTLADLFRTGQMLGKSSGIFGYEAELRLAPPGNFSHAGCPDQIVLTHGCGVLGIFGPKNAAQKFQQYHDQCAGLETVRCHYQAGEHGKQALYVVGNLDQFAAVCDRNGMGNILLRGLKDMLLTNEAALISIPGAMDFGVVANKAAPQAEPGRPGGGAPGISGQARIAL